MKFNPNGYVVQKRNSYKKWRTHVRNINYHGISAYSDYVLYDYRLDPECKFIQDEIWWINNTFKVRNFISDSNLLSRYVKLCKKFNISLRFLFIESEIDDEIWNESLPEMNFIGYEYCECPFDCQLISDLDMHEPFQMHRDKLNEYGLFSTLEDAQNFKIDYDKEFEAGIIGDGDMKTYIFRVSEVIIDYSKN